MASWAQAMDGTTLAAVTDIALAIRSSRLDKVMSLDLSMLIASSRLMVQAPRRPQYHRRMQLMRTPVC
jgi:hypothetical protein